MNRFKIVFFMIAAMACMAVTSWGDAISLNNNNYLIEASTRNNDGSINFEMGTIKDTNSSLNFSSESQILKENWGSCPTISLNDKNAFIEANLGVGGKQIYYNAGKVDPVTHQIIFTDTGFTFANNEGANPQIYLDNNGNFIEVHEGLGETRIVKTKTFPFFKAIPVTHLYYVTGKIDDNGKIIYLNTGRYCGYGETPIITTTDDNIFTEIHAGPDSGSPYSIIGNIDNEGIFLSRSGEGQIVAIDGRSQLEKQSIYAVRMTKVKDNSGDYNVTILTQGVASLKAMGSYCHIINGYLHYNGQIEWNSCKDIVAKWDDNVQYAAANDKYFVCYLSAGLDPDIGSYEVIPYNSSGN